MCVKLRRAKFQRSSSRGIFINWGLNGGIKKFNGKLAIFRKR